MRRLSILREADRAIVAIYDALLFLMVIILISEGMFLYTATVSEGGGGFSDDHYQHLTDTGRIMVEALSLNESHPMPLITYNNGTGLETRPLDEIVESGEADTVSWLLDSYVYLNWLTGVERSWYNASTILSVVDEIFSENRLEGTDHAWLFLLEGEVHLFGSNSVENVEDLPEDRWASVSNYTYERVILVREYRMEAELRYYLWLQ